METLERTRLHEQLDTLRLRHAARVVDELCHDATERQVSYTELLTRVLDEEITGRRDRGANLRIQLAHFPFKKTLEQFDFGFQPSIDQRAVEELGTLSFVREAGNIVLLGPPGVGKTHLAVALGLRACLAGCPTYFITAQELGRRLVASLADDTVEEKLFSFTKYALLVIDEMGYLPFEPRQANLLFQLIARRYETKSVILTTNKSFGQWAEIFGGDTAVASAILDRLLHHATVVNIRGPSYRLKDREKVLGLAAGPDLVPVRPLSSGRKPHARGGDAVKTRG